MFGNDRVRREMLKTLDNIATMVNDLNSTMGELVKRMEPQAKYYKRINDSTRDVRVIRSDMSPHEVVQEELGRTNTPRT